MAPKRKWNSARKAWTHEQARMVICIWCGKKKPCVRVMSNAVQCMVENRLGTNCTNDPRLPSGICTSCRRGLQGNSRHVLHPPINPRTYIYDHPTRTSPHKEESCYICSLAKMNAVEAQAQKVPAKQQDISRKSCPECYLPVSEESNHKCISPALSSIETTDPVDGKSEEEQAARLVRQKLMSEASTSRGKEYGTVTLATGEFLSDLECPHLRLVSM